MNMRTSMAPRSILYIIAATLLVGLFLPYADAAVTVEIGDYRELALQFVKDKYDLSDEAALRVLHETEKKHGDRVINSVEIPDGAVMDFVRVDGNAGDPDCSVTFEGSGVFRAANTQLFYAGIKQMLQDAPPDQQRHLREAMASAVDRGWLIQQITPEQRDMLMGNNRAPGEGQIQTQQASRIRILVVLCNFPHWDDESPAQGENNYDFPWRGGREHPLSESENWHTPGGPLNTDDWDSNGLNNPAWNVGGMAPQGGTNAGVSNHPRIEYTVEGRTGTSVDLKEHWFNFLFSANNPMSVANYYFANSNGNISIDGNRSDIVGPLESHHQLDRLPYPDNRGHSYAHQPGTPVIRELNSDPEYMGIPGLRGISIDSGTDAIVTLGWDRSFSVSGVQEYDPDDAEWDPVDIETRDSDAYYPLRRVTVTEGFDENALLRFSVGGQQVQMRADQGFNLDHQDPQGFGATLLQNDDVMGSDDGNRLLSMCYYTHDHIVENGSMGSRPYQLRHLENTTGDVDDIGGTVDDPEWHYRRPKPYDHDPADHAHPNMGYFEHPNSNGGHTYQVWLQNLHQTMADNGIQPEGYDEMIHLYPSDQAAGADEGGTSGPWSGLHVFIPNSAVVLPSDAGLYLTAHELGHTASVGSFPDLYDWDFYLNAAGVSPELFESNMMGPYSVMAHGGRRVDAFLKALAGWVTPIAVTDDIVQARVPEIEGTLQDPVVYKLPGRPFYIANQTPPDEWQEYYLVENRNRTGESYFGDISPRGLYIYHVDLRFGQFEEAHPMVIVEQADGLFELERNQDGNWGDMEGDPFPGSTGNRNFTQLTEPDSWSHGWLSGIGLNSMGTRQEMQPAIDEPGPPPPGVLQPGSSTDSFSRVTNISDPGSVMTADLYVVPREVIVTNVPVNPPAEVLQGTEDFLIMQLRLDNDSASPNLSRGDVELASIRIDEIGSSQNGGDVDRLSLFDDTNGNGQLDLDLDTRIATATLQNQAAYFTDLNYRIPLDEIRNVFVTYDVSESANTAEGTSLGAGLARFDYVQPEIPGAVQRRVREEITDSSDGLGAHRFPLDSQLVDIAEAPDTLTVTPISRAPIDLPAPPEEAGATAIEPGDQDVPILSLDMDVDHDSVAITRVMVDETGTIDAVADVTSAKLYQDVNGDGAVDGGDVLLEETTFANVGQLQRAVFDIATNPVRVTEGTTRSLLLTASLSEDLPLVEPQLTLQYTLEQSNYISLEQSVDIVSDENFPMSSDAVSTPVPNEPPAAPENVAASVIADGSILLTWELSNDDPNKAGENDVVRYNIYRATDPADFADVTPADAYATVEAGVTEYNDLNAPLGVDVYYMMRAWDGVQEGPNSNVTDPVQASDEVGPTFSDFDPAQGADGVPLDTTIAFVMSDNASGVDQDTLVFEVDGTDVAGAPETSISGTPARLQVEYDPPEDFDYLQRVNIRLQVSDTQGNRSNEVVYQFTTTGPPVHFIAGVITDAGGNPEPNVRVEAGGLFDMTNADGEYQVDGLAAGTYTVTPTKDDRSFQPEQRSVTVPPDAVAIDFTSQPGFDITGSVVTEDGDPLPGVTVTDGAHVDITGQDGQWQLPNIPAGTYGLVPMLDGWNFDPIEITVTVSTEAGDSTGNQFTAMLETFDVTGTIRTLAGTRLPGIDVQALQNDTVVTTATTNANGAYGLTGLEPGSYVIRPVDDNYAFDPAEQRVDVATDLANVDFGAAALYTMTLPAGLDFVSVPVRPMDPDAVAVFGAGVEIARWDPQAADYIMAPSNDPIMQVQPGAGFWTNSPDEMQLDIAGTPFDDSENLSLTAQRTWNMFGNPYQRTLPWEQVEVPTNGPASPYGFIWDADDNTYRLVSTAPGLGAVTVVPQNRGFWLRSSTATQISITGPGAAPASVEVAQQAQRKPADDAWIIPIVARAGTALDACSYAGVLPQAASSPATYQMDNPPAVGPYVDVYFLGDSGRRLAVDVRDNRTTQTWKFEVATSMADVQVEVQLPDLSEVPADRTVYLVDETAGKRMYARTLTTYSYPSGEGGTRRFSLEVADRSEAGLMITSASAQAAGGAVTVSYTLSAPAKVQVEILNIAGRKVATLAGGETAPAGLSTCGWNGRNASGSLAPAGRYLVRVSAAAEDGQKVQTLVPVQLQR